MLFSVVTFMIVPLQTPKVLCACIVYNISTTQYAPMCHIREFALWKSLLKYIRENKTSAK